MASNCYCLEMIHFPGWVAQSFFDSIYVNTFALFQNKVGL